MRKSICARSTTTRFFLISLHGARGRGVRLLGVGARDDKKDGDGGAAQVDVHVLDRAGRQPRLQLAKDDAQPLGRVRQEGLDIAEQQLDQLLCETAVRRTVDKQATHP